MDDLSQILTQDPENFDALYSLSVKCFQDSNYIVAFIMAERAIASFERTPREELHPMYFELKRMHYQMLHEHLGELIGPAYMLMDPHWTPVFRLGKIREMAWCVHHANVLNIRQAMNAVQLKRLRFLSITLQEAADNALIQLMHCPLSSLRALTLQFIDVPSFGVLQEFFETIAPSVTDLNTFGVRMPRVDDALASLMRSAFGDLDAFSITSLDRTGITARFCEELADDPRSNAFTRLCLVGTSIGNEGLFSLMSSENMIALQALDLHDGILTNAASDIIMASHGLQSLHSIDLRYNKIDPAGVSALSKSNLKCYCDGQHQRPEGRI